MAYCGLPLLTQFSLPAAGAELPPFADDGLCWVILAGAVFLNGYLLCKVLALRRKWAREDAWERTARTTRAWQFEQTPAAPRPAHSVSLPSSSASSQF